MADVREIRDKLGDIDKSGKWRRPKCAVCGKKIRNLDDVVIVEQSSRFSAMFGKKVVYAVHRRCAKE